MCERSFVAICSGVPTATIFVRLPFAVLFSRRVPADTSGTIDVTLDCTELLTWYGQDYGHSGREAVFTAADVCFPPSKTQTVSPLASVH